jgi:hypothetical protein
MQAILKSEHQRFYNWFNEIISKQNINDNDLTLLEAEIVNKYDLYGQKMEEIRQIILQYEEIKLRIRNKIKSNIKYRHDLI